MQEFARKHMPEIGSELGHVIYAIGMTANFRERPIETAKAHVTVLTQTLESCKFVSFLYLSSTRVYLHSEEAAESSNLSVNPTEIDAIYNVTKIAGESICLSLMRPSVRAVRLSNAVGCGAVVTNFLPSIVEDARRSGKVVLRSALTSAKDYIDIDDVCMAVEKIALRGSERLYNLASGSNTSNQTIVDMLRQTLDVQVEVVANAPSLTFPKIDIGRISREFAFAPLSFNASFGKLLSRN